MLVCIPHTHTQTMAGKECKIRLPLETLFKLFFHRKKSFISIFYAFTIHHRLSTIGVHQIRILYEFFTYLHNNYDAVDLYAVVRHNFNSSSSSSLRWGCIKTAHGKKGLVEQVNGENYWISNGSTKVERWTRNSDRFNGWHWQIGYDFGICLWFHPHSSVFIWSNLNDCRFGALHKRWLIMHKFWPWHANV